MTEQPRLLSGLLLALIVAGAGCTAGASSPGPSPSPSPAEIDGGNSDGGAGGGGAIIGKPIHPIGGNPIDRGVPPLGEPKMLFANPGQADVHPVSVVKLGVAVPRPRPALPAVWSSGIGPFTIVHAVLVRRGGS